MKRRVQETPVVTSVERRGTGQVHALGGILSPQKTSENFAARRGCAIVAVGRDWLKCKCCPCQCGKGTHRARLCYENDPSAKKSGDRRSGKPRGSRDKNKPASGGVSCSTIANRDPAEGLVCYANKDVSDVITENVVLETILCKIRMKDEKGEVVEKRIRAFLDTGLNMNIVRRSVTEGVQGKKSYFSPYITGGERIPPKQEKDVLFQLVSLDGKYESPRFLATTSESPTAPFPPVTFNPADYKHLKGVQFTETLPQRRVCVNRHPCRPSCVEHDRQA